MWIWLPASLLAGLFQAWRTALQHRLRAELSVNGAGLVRYAYGLPVALVLTLGYLGATGLAWPAPDATYLAWTAGAGLAQVLGTSLLILAFGFRNFVVGTAFAKTETVQSALFAWIVLGERLGISKRAGGGVAIAGAVLIAAG